MLLNVQEGATSKMVATLSASNLREKPSLNPNVLSEALQYHEHHVCLLQWYILVSRVSSNTGERREDFQVVIAGSNAYNKAVLPNPHLRL